MCDGSCYVSPWLGHWVPRHLVKYYSGYICEDVFLDEIKIWIGRPKAYGTPPVWMGLIWSGEGLSGTKRLTLPTSKRELLLPDCQQTETLALLGSWACLLSHCLSSVFGLPTADLGLTSLHNHMDQFLYLSIYLSIIFYHLSYWFFLKSSNTLFSVLAAQQEEKLLSKRSKQQHGPNLDQLKCLGPWFLQVPKGNH